MKWISVNKKLPTANEYVWCYSRDRGMVSDYFTGYVTPDGAPEFHGTRDEWDTHVTHWMPLPEPPQPEDRVCPVTKKNCEYICVMIDCFLSNEQNVKASVATEGASSKTDD